MRHAFLKIITKLGFSRISPRGLGKASAVMPMPTSLPKHLPALVAAGQDVGEELGQGDGFGQVFDILFVGVTFVA